MFKIVSIFAPYLYAIHYENEVADSYVGIMNNWRDVTYRLDFYKSNESFIQGNKYINVSSVEEFHQKVYNLSIVLDEALEHASHEDSLNEHFDYLDLNQNGLKLYSKRKAKNNFLRIYSIKVGNYYIVTGGAIKLTEKMQGHPLTQLELDKMEVVKNFFIENYITDEDSLFDYLIEQEENDE